MQWIFTWWGTLAICGFVWLASAWWIRRTIDTNRVQQINFGTINALFALVFIHLVLK